jgi:hypothetical protein
MGSYLKNLIQLSIAIALGVAIGYFSTYKDPEKTFLNERVDIALRPQVEDFLKGATRHGVTLDLAYKYVVFGDTKSVTTVKEANGNCDYTSGIVTINGDHWQSASADEKQLIIDHELGHCLLGRVHLSNWGLIQPDNRIIKVSIMSSDGFLNVTELSEFKDHYEEELFNPETFNQFGFQLTFVSPPSDKSSSASSSSLLFQ